MKNFHKRAIIIIAALVCLFVGQHTHAQQTLPDWALGPLVRPDGVKPIISPQPNTTFSAPMSKQEIAWVAGDIFNRAALDKGNHEYVLYRGADTSGKGTGARPSRTGIAESKDGIRMKREKKPVFYPNEDAQKDNEWAGGCEDPRIAVTADGLYVMLYTQWNRKVARLAVATSRDLKNWTKHEPAFQAR